MRVLERQLLEGSPVSPSIRSCDECYEVAKVIYLKELGDTRTKNGKTRTARITATLQANRGIFG